MIAGPPPPSGFWQLSVMAFGHAACLPLALQPEVQMKRRISEQLTERGMSMMTWQPCRPICHVWHQTVLSCPAQFVHLTRCLLYSGPRLYMRSMVSLDTRCLSTALYSKAAELVWILRSLPRNIEKAVMLARSSKVGLTFDFSASVEPQLQKSRSCKWPCNGLSQFSTPAACKPSQNQGCNFSKNPNLHQL